VFEIFKETEKELSKPLYERDVLLYPKQVTDLRITLRELRGTSKEKTVAFYTLVGVKRFNLLLITPDEIKRFSTPIKNDEFNETLLQFYAILRSREIDPRPLGKKLFDAILGPATAALKATGARTLLWSLDGHPRYIPGRIMEQAILSNSITMSFSRVPVANA
jgi:hypothetical protein